MLHRKVCSASSNLRTRALTIAPGAAAHNPAAATEGDHAATNQADSTAVKSEVEIRDKSDSETGAPAEEK